MPKPRVNLLIYHGVFGPAARLRRAAVTGGHRNSAEGEGPSLARYPRESSSGEAARVARTEAPAAVSDRRRRRLLWAISVAGSAVFLGAGALAFGGWRALLGHPARAAAAALVMAFAVAALGSPVNLSSGEREDRAARWIFLPALLGMLLYAWVVPWLDDRDLWVVDGDAARYLGLAVFAIGCGLRIWPMYVLGNRFSGLVAIQPHHELVTEGPYRWVRHPSYLGMLLGFAGWALVFRSALGLLVVPIAVYALLARIAAEEKMLVSHFGAAYEEYRKRTAYLVPGVY